MLAGTAKIDITPAGPVWMDGMIREHPSVGVHDPLFARALVLGESAEPRQLLAIVSVEVCSLTEDTTRAAREAIAARTGIPAERVVLAATHTHSGPATYGFFNPDEKEYTAHLCEQLAAVISEAAGKLEPAAVGCAFGREETINHYRRLLADDGHVVMNWEEFPAERIVRVLGEVDNDVGVLEVASGDDPDKVTCILFHHAGHPNVMSGENYLLSADYPGVAAKLLEQEFGAAAIYLNGAQGTMDIDGLRHRDWDGMERAGKSLAQAIAETARGISPTPEASLRVASASYTVPARVISDKEWSWAQGILRHSDGTIQAMRDGMGDDYKAMLYRDLRASQDQPVRVEQTCFAIGDAAFITFPGELYTEIGTDIKSRSPFAHTCIVGLANGYIGYVPTRKAISEGGYAEDARAVDESAEEIVVRESLGLLERVRGM